MKNDRADSQKSRVAAFRKVVVFFEHGFREYLKLHRAASERGIGLDLLLMTESEFEKNGIGGQPPFTPLFERARCFMSAHEEQALPLEPVSLPHVRLTPSKDTSMQIAIDLPGDFVAFQGEQSIRHDVKLSYALWLYQAERVTLSKAAEIAGVDIYDFMAACKESRIPVIAIDRVALIAELESLPE